MNMWKNDNAVAGTLTGIATAVSRTLIGQTGIITAILRWLGG